MGVRSRVVAGAYSLTMKWPSSPGKEALRDPKIAEAHSILRRKYTAQANKLVAKMRADLEAKYKLTGHPKAALLWQKAWDRGYSGGQAELCIDGLGKVCIAYNDLAELVTPTGVVP
jgi:single-stranded DNA-specific DHH superfamily exonuclease